MYSIRISLAFSITLVGACAFDESGVDGELPPPSRPEVAGEPLSPVTEPAPETPPIAYRVSAFSLRDPHMFAQTRFGCDDITDAGASSVNARTADGLANDRDGDGLIDIGLVVAVFDDGKVELAHADCTTGDSPTCALGPERAVTAAATVAQGACDEPPPDRLSDYQPPLSITGAPCLETAPFDFVLELDDAVPHSDVVLSLALAADGQSLTGTFRGFLSQVDADALEIGTGFSTVAISRFLPGGSGSCADHDARDVGPDGGAGWYSHFNFTAEVVALAL